MILAALLAASFLSGEWVAAPKLQVKIPALAKCPGYEEAKKEFLMATATFQSERRRHLFQAFFLLGECEDAQILRARMNALLKTLSL